MIPLNNFWKTLHFTFSYIICVWFSYSHFMCWNRSCHQIAFPSLTKISWWNLCVSLTGPSFLFNFYVYYIFMLMLMPLTNSQTLLSVSLSALLFFIIESDNLDIVSLQYLTDFYHAQDRICWKFQQCHLKEWKHFSL